MQEKKNTVSPLRPPRVVRSERQQSLSGTASKHKTAPKRLKLLVTVVDRTKAEFYMDLLQDFEINMQVSASASGTATSDILHLMGIEESEKRVILSLVREDRAAAALAMLDEKFKTIKKGKGIAMTVPLTGVIGVSIYRFLSNNR
jgi:hypothetical protein